MSWLSDPKGDGQPKLGFTYRILRRFTRSLMSVWFRELEVGDNENVPQDGGVMSVSYTNLKLPTKMIV